MTIETSLNKLIQDIKKHPEYRNRLQKFKEDVGTKDRTLNWLKYFLTYDIDDRKFKTPSEYSITHNQIAIWDAYLPPKNKKDSPIEFKEYTYNIKEAD